MWSIGTSHVINKSCDQCTPVMWSSYVINHLYGHVINIATEHTVRWGYISPWFCCRVGPSCPWSCSSFGFHWLGGVPPCNYHESCSYTSADDHLGTCNAGSVHQTLELAWQQSHHAVPCSYAHSACSCMGGMLHRGQVEKWRKCIISKAHQLRSFVPRHGGGVHPGTRL